MFYAVLFFIVVFTCRKGIATIRIKTSMMCANYTKVYSTLDNLKLSLNYLHVTYPVVYIV
jgi:hypothetical protein